MSTQVIPVTPMTISVITVTYNSAKTVADTMVSVAMQSYADIEHLVIDGSSKDNTLDIVRSHARSPTRLISESDDGIYDAMNKGLNRAKGDCVLFLNAGDTFASSTTLKSILLELAGNPDVLYGEAVFVNNEGQSLGLRSEVTPHRLPAQLSWRNFKNGMLVCHQAFIAKRSIAPLFNLEYRLSSDIDWEIQVLKKSHIVLKSEAPICNYLMGGASVQNLKRSWKERYQVLKSHFGFLPNLINHLVIIARGLIFAFKKQGKYW